MSSGIVIATNKYDSHADVVARLLSRRGYEPIMMQLGDVPEEGWLSSRLDGSSWESTITTSRGTVHLDDMRAVWWRKVSPNRAPAQLPPNEALFAEREGAAAKRGVLEALRERKDIFWMSHPSLQTAAANKIEQLQRAASMGFRVPKTLVTNNPDDARAFYDECGGQIIHKTMVHGFIGVMDFATDGHSGRSFTVRWSVRLVSRRNCYASSTPSV